MKPTSTESVIVPLTALEEAVSLLVVNIPIKTSPMSMLIPIAIDILLNYESDKPAEASNKAIEFLQAYSYGDEALAVISSLSSSLMSYCNEVYDKAYSTKDYGTPYVRARLSDRFITIGITPILPKTDYRGAMQQLVDEAKAKGEFVPFAVLEFIRKWP